MSGEVRPVRAAWPPEVPPWQPVPDIPWQPPGPQPAPARRPAVPEWWEPSAHSVDVQDQLLDRRIVLLAGFLDKAIAMRAVAAVMLLDARNDEPIEIRLSCADGDLEAAITLAETIDLATAPVRMVSSGTVGGPAVVVYAAAERRLAHQHCMFALREPRLQVDGRASEIAARVEQHQQQLDHCIARIAEATGQPMETIDADVRAGRVLTAQDALGYGLVHELLAPSTGRSRP